MDKIMLTALGNRLLPTGFEQEDLPYILTGEEEKKLIDHEIEKRKQHKAFKLREKNLPEEDIANRLSQIDWRIGMDLTEIFRKANDSKHYQIWQKEQRKKERIDLAEREKSRLETYNAKYFFCLMKYTCRQTKDRDLLVNKNTTPIITAVCFFLSRDPRFETELGFDLQKGLMIRGSVGLGKTFCVKCVSENDLYPVAIHSALEIADATRRTGEFTPDSRPILMIDDVGTEEETVNHYGTKINWIKNFLELFYLQNQDYNKLILSTNCNFDLLEKRYGFRVRSRFNEMFNVLDVSGEDLRKL